VALGRVAAAVAGAVVGAFAFGFSVSGPFCPQPAKPMVINAAIAKDVQPLATKLSVCSDIERILLTMPSAAPHTPLSDAEFREVAGTVLAGIEATVDRWLQNDVIDIDANRTGGMLELSFPDGSKIVINTQPPLQELWLAARRGGFHFKHVNGEWRDTRNGGAFHAVLSDCASEQGGKPMTFSTA
jgi:CyaY protein